MHVHSAGLKCHAEQQALLPLPSDEASAGPLQDLPSRPRRNRRSPAIRHAISETHISPANLILPVFVHDGEDNQPIHSMPGVDRLGWRHGLIDSVRDARAEGVNSVVIFPKASVLAEYNLQAEPALPAAGLVSTQFQHERSSVSLWPACFL